MSKQLTGSVDGPSHFKQSYATWIHCVCVSLWGSWLLCLRLRTNWPVGPRWLLPSCLQPRPHWNALPLIPLCSSSSLSSLSLLVAVRVRPRPNWRKGGSVWKALRTDAVRFPFPVDQWKLPVVEFFLVCLKWSLLSVFVASPWCHQWQQLAVWTVDALALKIFF